MKLYRLHARQCLPISTQEAWAFLSNPKSLNVITPKAMKFRVLSGGERYIFAGQVIQYTVKPFPFYKTRWITEITHVVEEEHFVDEQRFGPYSFWHHKHFIRDLGYGVELEDVVDYRMPFGCLGRGLHAMFVKSRVLEIFQYRQQELSALFGKIKGRKSTLNIRTI